MHDFGRRRFLATTAALSAGCLIPPTLWSRALSPDHPRLYVTARKSGALRSLEELRAAITDGWSRTLWTRILDAARADLEAPPLTPTSPLPGRTPGGLAQRNPDYVITHAAGQRVLRHAIVHLLTEEAGHRDAALRQIETLFDPEAWPRWLDNAHERYGHPADLRTGMLACDVGLAYDWLYSSLSTSERQRIVDGLDRYAIQPFLTSMAQDPWWIHDLNNWMTTIAGGVSIAAMALGEAHPQSQAVLDATLPLMEAYLTRYGPEGEFNESPAYAIATERPVMFYDALRYDSGGEANRLAGWPFPHASHWTMYLTLPPGRIAALGDSRTNARPLLRHVAAVAGATRDGFLQWFYLHNAGSETADPFELLWYDASLEAADPQGHLPLGRLFPAHGACFSSRSSWDPRAPVCVAYGTVSREENHEHNDDGQVCIDGYGERLIVDLGPPTPGYPPDFFDEGRWMYYNASVRGHNVLMIGGRERRHFFKERGTDASEALERIRGRLLHAEFDDARGGWWQADLTPTYEGARYVRRTFVHLLPGIVSVLDEAELPRPEALSLRWHTIDRSAPGPDGSFSVEGEVARVAARIIRLDEGPVTYVRGEHAYVPPYDRNRDGDPLNQLRESYVEATVTSDRCRLLTLFAVTGPGQPDHLWRPDGEGFSIATDEGPVRVTVTREHLHVENTATRQAWSIPLG